MDGIQGAAAGLAEEAGILSDLRRQRDPAFPQGKALGDAPPINRLAAEPRPGFVLSCSSQGRGSRDTSPMSDFAIRIEGGYANVYAAVRRVLVTAPSYRRGRKLSLAQLRFAEARHESAQIVVGKGRNVVAGDLKHSTLPRAKESEVRRRH
jgi:hypothetical protein